MRLVIQRVLEASVSVSGVQVSKIGKGVLVLLGITHGDTRKDAEKYAAKLLKLRIWPKQYSEDERKTWDTSILDNNFDILIVSQFTLYGVLKGNKPDFHLAMNSDEARELYEYFIQFLKSTYSPDKVQGGAFQQYMAVSLINDGPVTLIIESTTDSKKENSKLNPKSKSNKIAEESKIE